MEQRREADLHVLRQTRFIPIIMEFFKKVNVCPKNEINDFIRVLESATKVLCTFCGLRDNRTYMLYTNRP